jgi:hypothetical protein
MSDPLATYLHDHLAGSTCAVELLESLRDQHSKTELGGFAAAVLADVKEDQEVLQTIVDRVGKSGVDLKQAAAWLAEKASELKLRHGDPGGLGTLQALETLTLGIAGKLGLWRVLAVVTETDDRARGADFDKLIARAQEQHSRVEQRRMETARSAFKAIPK